MAAIRYRRIFTLILFVCLLLGAAAADEILDAPSLSSCLDCGFPEGHDPSCQAYVPDSHVPDVSDSCLECGAVAPEHLEGCLLYVPDAPVEPPVSSEAELPSSDPLPEDIPVEPLSFAEEMLVETSEPVAVYDAKSTKQPLTMTIGGVEYICFDLAAGNVVITENTYSGSYYKTESGEPQCVTLKNVPVTDGHKNYYIYQSNSSNRASTGLVGGNNIVLPNYERVGSPDPTKSNWGEYITNNTNVLDVVKNWESKAAAVYRNSTKNTISITGSGTYNITIDNVWSSFIEPNPSRTSGGLKYDPGSVKNSGKLTVTLVGDNRFGNVYYNSYSTYCGSQLIFQNSTTSPGGTLTVAIFPGDLDANHYTSVIGGNDSSGNAEGIIINGGTIFVGSTVEDNCSGIGGGGNDRGDVTINNGTVTVVVSSSGTAIGGGIGETSQGGKGTVTINGGVVYAYNHGFVSVQSNVMEFIPAAAIGGGSSCKKAGNTGKVTITGGVVYARSVGGTAIGGGSSTMESGGNAEVNISGNAQVTAISVGGTVWGYSGVSVPNVPHGAGIGGGTAGKGGSGNGGEGKLTVSGDAEVNTGSIGGGGVTNAMGSIGNAVVTINGGTLLGQVIMEGEGSNFRMEGGVIDNTNRAGYNFLQNDGGAVWIKAGNAQMSGGTINNTRGDKGGAIYVEGGSFTMSGGNITDVFAGNGGAVYVNVTDGSNKVSFTMTGGKIQNSTATSNGGAVSVENGKASLGGSARITNTTATSNGGAIYVSGGTVTMSGGTISDVSASNGGAIYVNAGSPGVDSFTMTGGTIQNAKATATDNGGGGAVYLSKGNFVMDSGSLLNNNATCNGGGAYVSDGSIIIGNGTLCNPEKNSTHTHPIVKDNKAQNGGAFAIFGGTLSVYCGNYSGNNATKSESDSIYQEDGYIYIYKGVDNESLPFNETFILGNTFVYTDNRLPLLTVQLYNSTKANVDEYVSKFVVDSSIYHSIRLNKSLLPAASLIPEDSNPMLIGWSLNKSDTCVTIKENSSSYYPEESKYPVTSGGYVNIYAIWGQSDKNYTIIIPDTIEITDDNNIRIGIDESEPFFIPNEVGRLNIILSQMDSSLFLLKPDISLEYKLKDKNGSELGVDDIVASFTYNQSKNYSNQGVTLTAEITDDDNEPVYAGTYSGIVTFSCSLVIDDYDQDKTDSKTCYTSSSLTSGVAS